MYHSVDDEWEKDGVLESTAKALKNTWKYWKDVGRTYWQTSDSKTLSVYGIIWVKRQFSAGALNFWNELLMELLPSAFAIKIFWRNLTEQYTQSQRIIAVCRWHTKHTCSLSRQSEIAVKLLEKKINY